MVKKSIPQKSKFNHSKKIKSYKSIIIVLIIAAIFIPITIYAVKFVTEMRTEAAPTEKPRKIEVTNITDCSVTVSWVTPNVETIGFIEYGTSDSLTNTSFDLRDTEKSNKEYYNHYVEITNLTSSTSYNYGIIVGGKEYKRENGSYYSFETGETLSTVPTPLPVKGKVADPSGGSEEIIVYAYLENDGEISNKLSALTDSKQYALDLANFRKDDLSETFTLLDGATLYVLAQGADRGEGSVTTEIVHKED